MTSLHHLNPTVIGIRVSSHSGLQNLAANITQQIAEGAERPYKEVIDVSSGDPLKAGLKPMTFIRQVLAVCMYPELLKDENFPPDVRQRAQRLLAACHGGSVGSYVISPGIPHVRQSIAEFIMKRDSTPFYKRINFTLRSTGVAGLRLPPLMILHLMASGEGDTPTGVLAPAPCPHTLPMLLDSAGLTMVPYQLKEDRGWALDLDELRRALEAARGRCTPRAIYISNPGNPTGHVQDRKSIEEVIHFVAAERLFLLVDEMYQDSVHGREKEFISYKRVLFEMGKEYSETVELASYHSLSSPCIGECGMRAAYVELVNLDPQLMSFVDLTTIDSPATGHLALDLMVNPPKPGDPSYDTHTQEILLTRATLSRNAQRAQEFLNNLPGMSCQPAMAGVYLYPCLDLPSEIIEQAKALEMEADVLYCQRLLEEEGVLLGAGCQNGDTTGKHHLRLSIHVPPATLEKVLARLRSFHLLLLEGRPRPDCGMKDRHMVESL